MTLNDLIYQIHVASGDTIKVERLAIRAGNTDGTGNYSIIKLKLDGQEIVFDNSTGVWANA